MLRLVSRNCSRDPGIGDIRASRRKNGPQTMIEPATKKDLAKLKTDLIRTLVTWQLINVAMVFGTYALMVGLYLRY